MVEIFVFGSNLAGRHGKGAALEAMQKWGAAYGRGRGFWGKSYAIATKDYDMRTRPLKDIEEDILQFIRFAKFHTNLTFRLTPIGCGLAGYKPEQIAPMFKGVPANVIVPEEFKPWLIDE
jgi:hypothetical protein